MNDEQSVKGLMILIEGRRFTALTDVEETGLDLPGVRYRVIFEQSGLPVPVRVDTTFVMQDSDAHALRRRIIEESKRIEQ